MASVLLLKQEMLAVKEHFKSKVYSGGFWSMPSGEMIATNMSNMKKIISSNKIIPIHNRPNRPPQGFVREHTKPGTNPALNIHGNRHLTTF